MTSVAVDKPVHALDFAEWYKGHHHTPPVRGTDEKIHVFAIAGPPVFGDGKANRWDFDIQVPLWGVTFRLHGYLNLSTFEIDAIFSVIVPIWGEIELGRVKGNLNEGVTISFSALGIISGTATFYIKDGWLYVDLSAKVFGTSYGPLTIRLIPIP